MRDFAYRSFGLLISLVLALHSLALTASAQFDFDNVRFWQQDSPGVSGTSEDGDFFGAAVASGDFNNDGYPDLAIGAGGEAIGDLINAGAVHVLYGGPGGLSANGNQLFTQETAGIKGTPGTNNQFGKALATGDFDNDGDDDLAIGAIGVDVAISKGAGGSAEDAGAVYILQGGPEGLTTDGSLLLTRGTPGIQGDPAEADQFGFTLATGDFNQDGNADLAVGSPLAADFSGFVNVIYGSPMGLTVEGNQLWTQNSPGIEEEAEVEDLFGVALAIGDFDNDGFDDLAVGASGETLFPSKGGGGPVFNAGVVHVIYGNMSGLTSDGSQLWMPGSDGLPGSIDSDGFGQQLTSGDFNGDGFGDLAISAPFANLIKLPEVGQVNVIYGSGAGLSTAGNQVWNQGVDGIEDFAEFQDRFGIGALASGDFDNDGFDDLAIGTTFEDLEFGKGFEGTIFENVGLVNLIQGRPEGLTAAGNAAFTFDRPSGNEMYGASLAAADFNLDGFDDLAGGAPGAAAGEGPGAGMVIVLQGERPRNALEDLQRQLRALAALRQLLSLLAILP